MIFWDHGIEWNFDNISIKDGSFFVEEDEYDLSGRGLKIIQTLASSFSTDRYGNINETKVSLLLF